MTRILFYVLKRLGFLISFEEIMEKRGFGRRAEATKVFEGVLLSTLGQQIDPEDVREGDIGNRVFHGIDWMIFSKAKVVYFIIGGHNSLCVEQVQVLRALLYQSRKGDEFLGKVFLLRRGVVADILIRGRMTLKHLRYFALFG